MELKRTYYVIRDSKAYGLQKNTKVLLTKEEAELQVNQGFLVPYRVAVRRNMIKDEIKVTRAKTNPPIKKTRKKR